MDEFHSILDSKTKQAVNNAFVKTASAINGHPADKKGKVFCSGVDSSAFATPKRSYICFFINK